MPNDERTFIPLQDKVPFDVFEQIFEKMMENADRRMEEGEHPGYPYEDDME